MKNLRRPVSSRADQISAGRLLLRRQDLRDNVRFPCGGQRESLFRRQRFQLGHGQRIQLILGQFAVLVCVCLGCDGFVTIGRATVIVRQVAFV